jgi:periplasmic protein TonB
MATQGAAQPTPEADLPATEPEAAAEAPAETVAAAPPPAAGPTPAQVSPASPLFAGFLADGGRRRRAGWGRRVTIAASVAAHAALVTVGVVNSFWTVDELSAPRVAVTMLTLPAAPPPPPPAAKTTRAAPRPRPRPTPAVVPAIVAPQPAPPPEREAEPADEEQAGEAEGVAGGVSGGVAGAVLSATAPPVLPQLSDAQRIAAIRRYLDEVLRPRVAAHASLPPEAERLGLEGRVLMRLWIDASGRLVAVKPAAACPHEILCEAAARAVRAAAPFPPPPPALSAGGGLGIDFPLTYRLD